MAIDAGAPDQIYQSFVNHGPAIQAALVAGADDLFAGLAVIELVWIIGWSVAHKTEYPSASRLDRSIPTMWMSSSTTRMRGFLE